VNVAVVGHVEFATFARVERVPRAGEIVHALEWWEEPAGGGAVAAVQLAKLAGACTLFTALGDDEAGRRSHRELAAMGLEVEAAHRQGPQRRVFTYLDRDGERTITTLGERLGPRGEDPLPWGELADADAVYFTAGDLAALRHARRARVLVATVRELPLLATAGVRLDAAIGSARDAGERYPAGAIVPPPGLAVRTEGTDGGTWETDDGRSGRYAPLEPPGPIVDSYGAGDSFAAGLTFALGQGRDHEDALRLAARCGAACAAGRGPYEGQLRLA
jgi:ribokinase